MLVRYLVYLLWLSSASILMAQGAQQTTLQALLDKTDSVASLTSNGTPFHAEMKISGAKKEPQYEGSIIVDWASPTKYRLEVRSVNFHQVQIVDGEQIEEHSDGDFYPGWLHSFVTALLSPMFVKPLLLEPKASIGASRSSNGTTVKLCVDRNDSPGGIRNDMVWSGICVNGEGLLLHASNFGAWIDFSDQKKFAGKQVARSYSISTGSYEQINGKLNSLRELQPAELTGIRVLQTTPPGKRIGFAFISTKDEEARLESAKPFTWLSVREGKSEGFMIVKALTDTTGQVRETSKYNSDNAELEEAGRQAALGYKFKPMEVDGVPVEIEMPLVLHFTSTIADPIPVLKGADLLKQIKGCDAKLVPTSSISAKSTATRIAINESGKLITEDYGSMVDPGDPAVAVFLPRTVLPGSPHGLVFDCRFTPLTRNGVVTTYHGDLLVVYDK
jgi:hypothetical protein